MSTWLQLAARTLPLQLLQASCVHMTECMLRLLLAPNPACYWRLCSRSVTLHCCSRQLHYDAELNNTAPDTFITSM